MTMFFIFHLRPSTQSLLSECGIRYEKPSRTQVERPVTAHGQPIDSRIIFYLFYLKIKIKLYHKFILIRNTYSFQDIYTTMYTIYKFSITLKYVFISIQISNNQFINRLPFTFSPKYLGPINSISCSLITYTCPFLNYTPTSLSWSSSSPIFSSIYSIHYS